MIIPPAAFSIVTANSVVGVDAKPISQTSNPIPIRVPTTNLSTMLPDKRASRPTTILLLLFLVVLRIRVEYAAVNFTTSTGLRPLPTCPPMVPLIPEIDLISVMFLH